MAVPTLCMQEKRGPTSEDCAQAMTRLWSSAGQTKASTATDLIAGGMDRLQLGSALQWEGRGTQTPSVNGGPAPPAGEEDTVRPEQQLREVFYKAVGGINDFDAPDGTTRRRKVTRMNSNV